MDPNLAVYEDEQVVSIYQHQHYLTRGENHILQSQESVLRNCRLLDIGVGAGRTTKYLLPLVAEYQGIDYSAPMVEACKLQFAGQAKAIFKHEDARNLLQFEANYFDVVLFSFNGIDTVDLPGRIAVLNAVRRVLKPGGQLIFSFHNIGYLNQLYHYQWAKNPFHWYDNLQRWRLIRKLNGPKEPYQNLDYCFIRDGGEQFRILICYSRPSWQIKQIETYGYSFLEAIDSQSGNGIDRIQIDQHQGAWIYLRCRKEL